MAVTLEQLYELFHQGVKTLQEESHMVRQEMEIMREKLVHIQETQKVKTLSFQQKLLLLCCRKLIEEREQENSVQGGDQPESSTDDEENEVEIGEAPQCQATASEGEDFYCKGETRNHTMCRNRAQVGFYGYCKKHQDQCKPQSL